MRQCRAIRLSFILTIHADCGDSAIVQLVVVEVEMAAVVVGLFAYVDRQSTPMS